MTASAHEMGSLHQNALTPAQPRTVQLALQGPAGCLWAPGQALGLPPEHAV